MPTVIQITDCHLFADPAAEIRGLRTRDRFLKVWEHVARSHGDADLLLITGDLTHDEQRESYLALRMIVADWLPRLQVIPGNHDDRSLLREIFSCPSYANLDRIVFVDNRTNWQVIGLDTHIPGQLAGELGKEQLHWLEKVLQEQPATPTLLCMHHPPILVNSPWLDRIGLQDPVEFQRVVDEHPQIQLIVAGHVHQDFTGTFAGVPVLTTPSTGLQFRPGTETLEIDEVSPGYRLLDLKSSGTWATSVTRV